MNIQTHLSMRVCPNGKFFRVMEQLLILLKMLRTQ
nr:MAG TPA: Sarcoglycan complex subunit protein [Caudoviricetes sp.]